jgi:nucleolar GTP-binding protein
LFLIYRYLRWQVVDTPGILDHPLVDRNTIEMQAITALAHLRAAVLYVMDISEQCGQSIEQQVELFNNIKPLFTNKPIIVALNKVDIITPQELREEAKDLLASFEAEGIIMMPMSSVTEEGVVDVKTRACDELLMQRVDVKMKSKKMPELLNRLHLATPKPRDETERPPFIPPGAKIGKKKSLSTEAEGTDASSMPRKLEKDILVEMGDDYLLDLKKHYLLANDDEKYDDVPEIFEGKNVADYIDPEIMERLDELEREEEMREAAGVYNSEPEDPEVLETRKIAVAIRKKKSSLHKQNIEKRSRNYPIMPRRGIGRVSRKKDGEIELMEEGEGEGSDMECGGMIQGPGQ